MTANDEIVRNAYEINKELGVVDRVEEIPTSTSQSIEEPEAEIIEESPVYVEEGSIYDILELNELNKKIEDKKAERDKKEAEIDALEAKRSELGESIGIINTGDGEHVQESLNKLQALRELDVKISSEKDNKEAIYRELTDLERKGKELDSRARNMVAKMTKDYNDKASNYSSAVESYIRNRSVNDFNRAQNLAKELSAYKKFETFEAILKDEEPEKEDEKAVVTELNEVKVDSIKDPEGIEYNPFAGTPADFEFPSETIKKEEAAEKEKQEAGYSTQVVTDVISETKPVEPTPTEPLPVEPTIETTEVVPEETKPIGFDDIKTEEQSDKPVYVTGKVIADTTQKGARETINAFNQSSQKVESPNPTLTLAN